MPRAAHLESSAEIEAQIEIRHHTEVSAACQHRCGGPEASSSWSDFQYLALTSLVGVAHTAEVWLFEWEITRYR